MTFKHRLTNQNLLLKTKGDQVSLLYHLNEEGEKIRETGIYSKQPALDVNGNPAYKMAVCKNQNLIKNGK